MFPLNNSSIFKIDDLHTKLQLAEKYMQCVNAS